MSLKAQKSRGCFVDARIVPGVLRGDPARGVERGERIVATPSPELRTRQFDEVVGAAFSGHHGRWLPPGGLAEHGLAVYTKTDGISAELDPLIQAGPATQRP